MEVLRRERRVGVTLHGEEGGVLVAVRDGDHIVGLALDGGLGACLEPCAYHIACIVLGDYFSSFRWLTGGK